MERQLTLALCMWAGPTLVHGATPGPAAKPRAVLIDASRSVPNDCARVRPLRRLVPRPALLTGAVRALLAGPTGAERAHGYGGWFSAATGGHLQSAGIARGVAYIDARNRACATRAHGEAIPDRRPQVYSFDGSRRAFLRMAATSGAGEVRAWNGRPLHHKTPTRPSSGRTQQ